MRKLFVSMLLGGFLLTLSSFTTSKDSKECEDYAYAAANATLDAGGYLSGDFNQNYQDYKKDLKFYYDYCEANCTQCNTPGSDSLLSN